jgi:archaellum component FlaC
MTKTENERLAIVEEQIKDIKLDITEIKKDLKTILGGMPTLCKDVKRLEEQVEKHDTKINSAFWMTLTAIVAFIGSTVAWLLRGIK